MGAGDGSSRSAATIAFRRRREAAAGRRLLDPDVERILALRPDLVIVYDTQTELRTAARRARTSRCYEYTHEGSRPISPRRCARSALASECDASANALADGIEAQLTGDRARVWRTADGRGRCSSSDASRGRCANIDASGGYGFLHDMLEIAGGARSCSPTSSAKSVQMTTEMVLARAPGSDHRAAVRRGDPTIGRDDLRRVGRAGVGAGRAATAASIC